MCGILGWAGAPNHKLAESLLQCLNHRGPDASGSWLSPSQGTWFGHKRLSIIDLSDAGSQPMHSANGRFTITYNGEIYNFPAIRSELAGHGTHFRGESDTETLLEAISLWGLGDTLKKLIGMFAFALYDKSDDSITLVRDRLGIKPLYYAHSGSNFAFCSELTPLRHLDWIDQQIDSDALHCYFRYLCTPNTATIFSGVRKLAPGHILRWKNDAIDVSPYWNHSEVVSSAQNRLSTYTYEEATDVLETLLRDAIRMRLLSDVPLGAFLSGGIDSSTVVALMQSLSDRPVKTFSIGYSDPAHDESGFAKAVADHLGTEHNEWILSPQDILDHMPTIIASFDEPFADVGAFPMYLVSKFARQSVTVCLSGDGGDELFGGYPRYAWAKYFERAQRILTKPGARMVGNALRHIPLKSIEQMLPAQIQRHAGSEGFATRLDRLAGYLQSTPRDIYQTQLVAWANTNQLLTNPLRQQLGADPSSYNHLNWGEQMMAVDQRYYLVDDILTKVDRASMAHSLEARVPLLDHRIVEWSWRLPQHYKLSRFGAQGRRVLRNLLKRYVPPELFARPKIGFGMPVGSWLRNELREWAEDMLNSTTLDNSQVLHSAPIRQAWNEHLDGQNRTREIWTVLMFLEWERRDAKPTSVVEGDRKLVVNV